MPVYGKAAINRSLLAKEEKKHHFGTLSILRPSTAVQQALLIHGFCISGIEYLWMPNPWLETLRTLEGTSSLLVQTGSGFQAHPGYAEAQEACVQTTGCLCGT